MTIYLPEQLNLFRQAFDATYDRIIGSENDVTFFALFVELVEHLREHPLLRDFIIGLEAESTKHKAEFSAAALEALEDSWMRLWKYHRRDLKYRKQLIGIKRIITAPNEFSFSSLFNRISIPMWEFRYFSPLCSFINEGPRLLRAAQSELRIASYRFDYLYPSRDKYFVKRKVMLSKLSKKDRHRKLQRKIFTFRPVNATLLKHTFECFPIALYSPKTEAVEKNFFIPGQNISEKRKNMKIMAETSPAFCWERIRFLQQCYVSNKTCAVLKSFKGPWSSYRETAWQVAQERCEVEAKFGAKMALDQKLSIQPSSSIDSFLDCEHQIHRRDYEKYLHCFKNHVHAYLFKIESLQQKAKESPLLALPGTQKEDFVIDLARQFWEENPLGKRDDAYHYYSIHCPYTKILQRDRWDQIVRKRDLDPRPREAQKRGPGKKTCKK